MKDKGHFYISLIKSLLRIFGCSGLITYFGINNIVGIFASAFLVAELLGIAEEVADKR